MDNNQSSPRIPYYDALRAFASFLVVILHVAAQNWETVSVKGIAWNCFNVYDCIARCGVPIFLMVSGALFLSKDISLKRLYSKNVLRMLLAYIVWSVFYAVVLPLVGLIIRADSISLKMIVVNSISGHYHMWFIPLIIGMYICVPILKKIAENKKIAFYFLVLSFIFSFLLPVIFNLILDFCGGMFEIGVNMLKSIINEMHLELIIGYPFYFVAGYFISVTDFSRKQRRILYLLGILGVLFTIFSTIAISVKTGEPCATYYNNITANIALYSIAIFVWFKYNVKKTGRTVNAISKYSFGIYLIHVFILEVLEMFGVNSLTFIPILAVPVIAAITFAFSLLFTFLIRKIPFVEKMKIA